MSAMIEGKAVPAFKGQGYIKFAATVDENGVPNVVPLLSARMVDPETIAFVRFMVWKTARNFESNRKITIACPGPGGRAFVAKGEFQQWLTQGPLLEEFESEPLYRYNAYTGANALGLIRVKDVRDYPGTGVAGQMLYGLARRIGSPGAAGPRGNGSPMPSQVKDKFNRALAVKFVGFIDGEGDPVALPVKGMRAPDSKTISFPAPAPGSLLHQARAGSMMAASVLAFLPVAYQVKGSFSGFGSGGKSAGSIEVSEVYSAAPPVPGRRIWPPEDRV